jgi:hypothetical protein
LQRRSKLLLLLLFGLSTSGFAWFTLSLPTPFGGALIPSTFWTLMTALGIAGLFQVRTIPPHTSRIAPL